MRGDSQKFCDPQRVVVQGSLLGGNLLRQFNRNRGNRIIYSFFGFVVRYGLVCGPRGLEWGLERVCKRNIIDTCNTEHVPRNSIFVLRGRWEGVSCGGCSVLRGGSLGGLWLVGRV